MKVTVPVWDLPHRLFHWLLVAAVIASYITAKIGGALIDWHGRLGIFILGLLVFRVLWGFMGSTHSRFATFFPTLGRIKAYLQGHWHGLGHNPLGALSVFALLAAIAVQVGTGLFANDDIAFNGPLNSLVDKAYSDQLTGWHTRTFYVLLGLVGLHLAALIYYRWVKKTNLITPMLTGKKELPASVAATLTPPQRSGLIRLALSLLISSSIAWGLAGVASTLNALSASAPTPPPSAGF